MTKEIPSRDEQLTDEIDDFVVMMVKSPIDERTIFQRRWPWEGPALESDGVSARAELR
jgi:hypothetical protein